MKKKTAFKRAKQRRRKSRQRSAETKQKISDSFRKRAEEKKNSRTLAAIETSHTMSVRDLARIRNKGLNQVYSEVKRGVWPAIRTNPNGPFEILTKPVMEILAGTREPGPAKTLSEVNSDADDQPAGGAPWRHAVSFTRRLE